MNRRQRYLIAYDIADPRRLQRVAHTVERIGIRLQYSLFLAQLTPRQRQKLLDELRQLIDPKADDLRFYPLPARSALIWLGKGHWPEGVQLLGTALPALTHQTDPAMVCDTHPQLRRRKPTR